ncbi:MAG: Wzt carbohydrate-binding domain-containing protein, partial [Acidobacteriota bacterium]
SNWPPENIRIDLSGRRQLTDGRARCRWLAVCNDLGESTRSFRQGERAHFFYEFEMLEGVEAPVAGVEFLTETGILVHGKDTIRCAGSVPEVVRRGARLRFHQWVELQVAPGRYEFNLGLVGTDPDCCRGYVAGGLSHEEYSGKVRSHCRVPQAGRLEVGFGEGGKLSHHGLVNLPGGISVHLQEPESGMAAGAAETEEAPGCPTVFHITHWKAGSQWIGKILRECLPERIIEPQLGETQVRHYAIQRGCVYPAVYLTKPEFDELPLPPNSRWFVVIRDLRDTLVSAYFSFKVSHPLLEDNLAALRLKLQELDQEAGLLHLMDHFLPSCASIQLSWLEAGEPLLKYEDLLVNDVDLLEQTLIDRCRLAVGRERLREAVLASRFEAMTGGRARGREDVTAHERKGVAGDWRNHFTGKLKDAFKARYGGLLVATGYEHDLAW